MDTRCSIMIFSVLVMFSSTCVLSEAAKVFLDAWKVIYFNGLIYFSRELKLSLPKSNV